MKAARLCLFTCVVTYAPESTPRADDKTTETFLVFARNSLTAKFMLCYVLSLLDRARAIKISAELNE